MVAVVISVAYAPISSTNYPRSIGMTEERQLSNWTRDRSHDMHQTHTICRGAVVGFTLGPGAMARSHV